MQNRLETTLLDYLSRGANSRTSPKRVAVAMGNNPEVIGCIGRGIANSLAEFVLVGPADEMQRTADDAGVDISSARIVEEHDAVAAAGVAAQLASTGEVDVLMKGLVQTADFVRAILDKSRALLPAGGVISHVAVADVATYHKLLVLTDAAITVNPSVEERVELIRNAARVARSFGVGTPRVACVAPVEKVSEKVPSTVDASRLRELFAGADRPVEAIVDGPFGLDVALSAEAAAIKGVGGNVAGNADIILTPGIDAGNILYKSISILAGGTISGVVGGARVPIVLTSRADSEESKYLSLLLALVSAT